MELECAYQLIIGLFDVEKETIIIDDSFQ